MAIDVNTKLTFSLTLQNINIVMMSLGKQPYEVVNELITDIRSQVVPQLQQEGDNVQAIRPPPAAMP